MTKPISPDDVVSKQLETIPDRVIEVWNTHIAKNWAGTSSIVMQEDILRDLRIEFGVENREIIYDRRWLDIEDIYRQAGWDVEYDKPGYNESYVSKFIFRRGKK